MKPAPALSRARYLVLLILVLIVALPSSALAASPTRKIALGISQNPDTSLAALDAFTASVGTTPAIWSIWSAWGGSNAAFPDIEYMNGLRDRGVVAQVFWEPVDPTNGASVDDPRYTYRSIIRGDHDEYVRQWAKDAKAWGGTVLLKFAHEMNAWWFPWGIGRSDNTVKRFKLAWRRVHDLIRGPGGEGAKNVKLVWSVYDGCSCPSNKSLYPGDAYVQYAGFSTFDWAGNRTMKQMFATTVQSIMAISSRKIIVTETGTPSGERKPGWIRQGYPAVYAAFPRVAAIVYFDVEVFGQPNWRLTQPESALAAFASVMAKPRFQGRIK